MNKSVTIIENSKTGKVVTMKTITDKETKETRQVGYFIVQSKALTGLSRIGRVSTRTAVVTLELDGIELADEIYGLNVGSQIPGNIVIQETLTPYIKKDKTKQDAKINPRTKQPVLHKGQPVYRNSIFDDTFTMQDVLLASDKVGVTNASAEE